MKRMGKHIGVIFALLGLALTVSELSAQQIAEEIPPRRIMVFYRNETTVLSKQENLLLYEALLISLQGVREDCFILEGDPLEGPDGDDDRSSLARRRVCDGWFFVRTMDAAAGGFTVEYSLYDSVNEFYVVRTSFSTEMPDARDLTQIFWRDVVDSLKLLRPLDPLPSYIVRGLPGTRVFGFGKGAVDLGTTGAARVTVSVPALYSLRAEKPGYDPLEKQVLLKEKGGEILLEQKRGALFTVDVSLQNVQFPGFDFGVYVIPNSLFLKMGITSFLRGLGGILTASKDESFDPIVDYPFMHLGVQGGAYFGVAEARVRTYMGFGGLARIFFGESETTLEPVIPFGLFPIFGLEFSPNPKGRVYIEATPTFYYVRGKDLYPAGFQDLVGDTLYPSGGVKGFAVFDRWYLDYMVFKVGYRWHL